MKIAHIAVELHPIAKVGGLGDVVYGLAKEQKRQGHTVEILLPKYQNLHIHRVKDLQKISSALSLRDPHTSWPITLWRGSLDGLSVIFFEVDHPSHPFAREEIYGYDDDLSRFALFCRAAIAYLETDPVQILHTHDWHTALATALHRQLTPVASGCVISIHNALYQGRCHKEALGYTGLNLDDAPYKDLYDPGLINLLKAGMLFSDRVVTVSPTYAHDVQHTHDGFGLQSVFHAKGVRGILNGIDYDYWNPAIDPFIPHHYDRHDLKALKQARRQNREALQKELGMAPPHGPLVAAITRLVPQKGPELIKAALIETVRLGGQAILLGSHPPHDIAQEFRHLAEEMASNPHIHFDFRFNESLGHKLYASSDLLLVPSHFEPCGLTQMIAMRYGAIPLVRATGGLADSVFDGRNGFSFHDPHIPAVIDTLKRAFALYETEAWQKMIAEGAKAPFTWARSAAEFQALYSEIL